MAAEGCGLPLAAQASPRNLKRPRRLRRRVKRATHRLRRRAREHLVLVDLVVDAIKVRASNDLAGVQERDALASAPSRQRWPGRTDFSVESPKATMTRIGSTPPRVAHKNALT
jgi:hypothetical protein